MFNNRQWVEKERKEREEVENERKATVFDDPHLERYYDSAWREVGAQLDQEVRLHGLLSTVHP